MKKSRCRDTTALNGKLRKLSNTSARFFQPKLDAATSKQHDTRKVSGEPANTLGADGKSNFFRPAAKHTNGINAGPELETYIGSLNGSGAPLPKATREFFEHKMGYDFNNVSIHTGTAARQSARSAGALAYTVGNNIVLRHDRFDPRNDKEKKLLAHELAHVIQQGNSTARMIRRKQDDSGTTNYVADMAATIAGLEREVDEKCGDYKLQRLTRTSTSEEIRILQNVRRMLLAYWVHYDAWKSDPTEENEFRLYEVQGEVLKVLYRAGLHQVIGLYNKERSMQVMDCLIAQANLKLFTKRRI